MVRVLKCSRADSQSDEKVDISTYKQNHKARVLEMKTYQAANKERILSQPYRASASQLSSAVADKKGKRGRRKKDSNNTGRDPPTRVITFQEPEPDNYLSLLSGSVNFSLKYYNPQVCSLCTSVLSSIS